MRKIASVCFGLVLALATAVAQAGPVEDAITAMNTSKGYAVAAQTLAEGQYFDEADLAYQYADCDQEYCWDQLTQYQGGNLAQVQAKYGLGEDHFLLNSPCALSYMSAASNRVIRGNNDYMCPAEGAEIMVGMAETDAEKIQYATEAKINYDLAKIDFVAACLYYGGAKTEFETASGYYLEAIGLMNP